MLCLKVNFWNMLTLSSRQSKEKPPRRQTNGQKGPTSLWNSISQKILSFYSNVGMAFIVLINCILCVLFFCFGTKARIGASRYSELSERSSKFLRCLTCLLELGPDELMSLNFLTFYLKSCVPLSFFISL